MLINQKMIQDICEVDAGHLPDLNIYSKPSIWLVGRLRSGALWSRYRVGNQGNTNVD